MVMSALTVWCCCGVVQISVLVLLNPNMSDANSKLALVNVYETFGLEALLWCFFTLLAP